MTHALGNDLWDSSALLLRQLSADLAQCSGVERIAQHALRRLGETLDLAWAAISLHASSRPGLFCWGACPSDAGARSTKAGNGAHDAGRLTDMVGVQALPLVAGGLTMGTLLLGPKPGPLTLRQEDDELLPAIAGIIALALQGGWLNDELEAQAAVLGDRERELAALSAQLLRAQEAERHKLAQELHDDPLQRTILLARHLHQAPSPSEVTGWRAALEETAVALQAICAGLRVLEDFGLVGDLQAQTDFPIFLAAETADATPFGRLPGELELALFRITQEALHNSLKHAQATQAVVILWRDGHDIRLSVRDDGHRCLEIPRRDEAHRHVGILGMQERLRRWGGTVTVAPGSPHGTLVVAEVTAGNDHGA